MSESKFIHILFFCKGKNCKGNLIDFSVLAITQNHKWC